MLSSANRLRSARDIARVYKQGVYGAGGGALSLKALRSGRATTRAVVVVGKKIDKRAVVRNRIRRRLIEQLRPKLATVGPGYDIVVTVHSNIETRSVAEMAAYLDQALVRARLVKTT
jgi:ribonuclease P protein component